MGLRPGNTALLLWLTVIGAKAEGHHAIFHHQGEVVLGHDFCHLLIDLDLNNITQLRKVCLLKVNEMTNHSGTDSFNPYRRIRF